MTYGEVREVFRVLGGLEGRYSVTDAICDDGGSWTVGVVVRRKYAYRFSDLHTFESRFPHLMMVYEEPRYYGSAAATMSWLQTLFTLGWVEQSFPQARVHGLMQSPTFDFELAISKDEPTSTRGTRSGIYLVRTVAEAERILAA